VKELKAPQETERIQKILDRMRGATAATATTSTKEP
jgi:hypothetical protein